MIRTLMLSIGLLAVGGLLAQDPAPAPAAAATSEFYPLKAGNKWTYRIDEQRSLEVTVDKFENGEATLITKTQGRQVAKEVVKVEPDGIYRTRINDIAITPPVKILALPPAKDASWDLNSTVSGKPITGKMTIKEMNEKLKLKDGKEYECVMVEGADCKVEGTPTKIKVWFASGKGIVKLTYETGGQEASQELIEFTEGK